MKVQTPNWLKWPWKAVFKWVPALTNKILRVSWAVQPSHFKIFFHFNPINMRCLILMILFGPISVDGCWDHTHTSASFAWCQSHTQTKARLWWCTWLRPTCIYSPHSHFLSVLAVFSIDREPKRIFSTSKMPLRHLLTLTRSRSSCRPNTLTSSSESRKGMLLIFFHTVSILSALV